jgi:hypothetical protein
VRLVAVRALEVEWRAVEEDAASAGLDGPDAELGLDGRMVLMVGMER